MLPKHNELCCVQFRPPSGGHLGIPPATSAAAPRPSLMGQLPPDYTGGGDSFDFRSSHVFSSGRKLQLDLAVGQHQRAQLRPS